VLEQFKAWADKLHPKVAPSAKLGQALCYLLNHWPGLVRYCDQGHYDIDNNLAERAIRPFCIGRNNWKFADTQAGTQAGAHASAKLYSIVQTAKANGLEPYAYLKHLFTELPKAKTPDAIEALLPYRIDADIGYFDTDCDEVVDGNLIIPDDPTENGVPRRYQWR
jgi:transposase